MLRGLCVSLAWRGRPRVIITRITEAEAAVTAVVPLASVARRPRLVDRVVDGATLPFRISVIGHRARLKGRPQVA